MYKRKEIPYEIFHVMLFQGSHSHLKDNLCTSAYCSAAGVWVGVNYDGNKFRFRFPSSSRSSWQTQVTLAYESETTAKNKYISIQSINLGYQTS